MEWLVGIRLVCVAALGIAVRLGRQETTAERHEGRLMYVWSDSQFMDNSVYGELSELTCSVSRSDFRKDTICQRCGSGSFDHTGIPRRTTPLVNTQKSAPGAAP